MINPGELRSYHVRMALYCLQREPGITAGELYEAMNSASLYLEHPSYCYVESPSQAAGILRELAGKGQVEKCEQTRRNSRSGRDEATWRCAAAAGELTAPRAPGRAAVAAQLPVEQVVPAPALPIVSLPVRGLTQDQRVAFLRAEFEEMQARMRAEFETYLRRVQRVLGEPA